MNIFSSRFNKDQLDALANLLFDLSKGCFALIFLPITSINKDPILGFTKVLMAIIAGIAISILIRVQVKATSHHRRKK